MTPRQLHSPAQWMRWIGRSAKRLAILVLGTLSRTGPITWQVPHAANLTLRQLGILVFLGAIGIRSGATFADAVGTGVGARVAVAAAILTL